MLILDLMPVKEESKDMNEVEEKHHDFTSGEKSFSCMETDNNSSKKQEGTLKTRSKRRFACSQCGKSFLRKGHLHRHIRIHTGERPFICKQCGKGFNQKGNLKIHMSSHTGESPFTCKICGKSFSLKGNLKYHMKIHSGEKPFECSQCGKTFQNETIS